MFKHKIHWLGRAIFLCCAILATTVYAVEPRNLYDDKQRVIRYHDSGEYEYDIDQVVQRAQAYLQQRVLQNQQLSTPKKLAVVFDIDETTLSNYPNMYAFHFGGPLRLIEESINKGQDPAIKPVLRLYQLAEHDKVAVFFITGRTAFFKDATVSNLKSAGYTEWDGLVFRPKDYSLPSIATYKAMERSKIVTQGYDIVLNMGDQYSDLNGGFADRTFKLPNPYYHLP